MFDEGRPSGRTEGQRGAVPVLAVAVLVYLGGLLVEATDQLGQLHSQTRLDLTERFLAWDRARG